MRNILHINIILCDDYLITFNSKSAFVILKKKMNK